jgi:transposase
MVAALSTTIHREEANPMAQPMSVLGIDLATRAFHGVGMDDSGPAVLRKRLARRALLPLRAKVPPLRLGMAARGSAHDWARQLREPGHDVRLSAPPFSTASVQSPKNAAREAEASGAAVTRPTMRFVPVTRAEQQDLQALHRARERLIKARPAVVHESRGLRSEAGMIVPQRLATFRALIADKRHEEQAKRRSAGSTPRLMTARAG